ncbi:hypothetical protein QFC22_001441 [Naganishia vaughanmartiniae]|uniref:Uncharacterized protein n=1 Tax=Naganishia vaughanmartiniae TaxID=1424756 RepID=A0ACC2XI30_9TREE|nr:hypothetical protein QFC22_001441 [Naganishia vaughanmartiniae]
MSQAFAESTVYDTDHLKVATRTILAHIEAAEGSPAFHLYDHPIITPSRQSQHSKKGRSNLSIKVPTNITKHVVASPNTVDTALSVDDEPNISVEPQTANDRDIQSPHQLPPQHMMHSLPMPTNQVDNAEIVRAVHTVAAPTPQPPKKKKSHARKQPVGHIPRPRNAFILFRKHITDNDLIPKSVEVKHQNISIVASKMWAEAPPAVKAQFTEAAKKEKEEHARLYPNYRYQPAYRRTDIIRRRVRKDPLEDDKCDAVASLLIQGKAGDALESEVKEKIAEKNGQPISPTQIKLVVKKGRRKRKDAPGELSKGAIRAQKAADRARAMREHWMDTSMLLAQQTQGHMLRRAPLGNYYNDVNPHDVVYVDEFGRQVYVDDVYDLPYVDGPEGNYMPANPYAMALDPNMHVQYGHHSSMAPQMAPHQSHDMYGHTQVKLHQGTQFAPPDMYDMHGVPDPNLHYAQHPHENVQQWGTQGGDLRPWEAQRERMAQNHLPEREPLVPSNVDQSPANYALDPMLIPSEHTQNEGMYAYNQFAQEEQNIPAMEEYRNISMPSDIIAGRWARDHLNPDIPAPDFVDQVHGENVDTALPLMENEHLPSQHIDFGDKGELFGGDLNEVLPLDPDIEDYNAAFQQQQDMDGFAGQI